MSKKFLPHLNSFENKNWVESFLGFEVGPYDRNLQKNEDFLVELGKQKALDLFHRAALNVPAYKHFLKLLWQGEIIS